MITYDPNLPRQIRLNGQAVFLSASVPRLERNPKYSRTPDAAVSIEEAVVALSRAVFAAGGVLVFGAHPSISPLVAGVIGEYAHQRETPENSPGTGREINEPLAEPRLVMYQSEVWRRAWDETSRELSKQAEVKVIWTPVVNREAVDSSVPDRPQAPASMSLMRETMIKETKPIAMVVIGGMEGAEEEMELFARIQSNASIFALASTGGAAALIQSQPNLLSYRIKIPDTEGNTEVQKFWLKNSGSDQRESQQTEGTASPQFRSGRYYVPYSFFVQQIITSIAG